MTPSIKGWRQVAAALGIVALTAMPSLATDVWLVAKPLTKTMPDTTNVPMWGFALATTGFASVGAATVPGPTITLAPTDVTPLTIHLRNDLTTHPVSIVTPGLVAALNPVRFTDPQGRMRVKAFTAEAAPSGGLQNYTFTTRPGTFLYQSGSHPSIEVPMGLYGAVKKNASATTAYTGVPFENEAVLLYSEIDPALNNAVSGDTFGTPAYPGSINYKPTYFLINGNPYPAAAPVLAHAIVSGERVLLRLLNAGLKTHMPAVQGQRMQVVAEDGNLYPYQRDEYEVHLPAGKTTDAVLTVYASGNLPVFDRALALTNAGATGGGMLTNLGVGSILRDVQIAASSDDAEERLDTHSVNITSSDLELTLDAATQSVGMRFPGLLIPQGAHIDRAWVQFQVKTVDPATPPVTNLTVVGQASGNAATFTTATSNITNVTLRPRTTAMVPWPNVPAWITVNAALPAQRTPDIASIVQEIVSRTDWASGNALVIMVDGTGKRIPWSYDGLAGGAPRLHVEYSLVQTFQIPATTTTTSTTTSTTTTTSTSTTTTTSTSTTTTTSTSTTTTTTVPAGVTTVSIPVSTNNDDAEERTTNGAVSLGSSDLELVLDSVDQVVGIRFLNVPIPHLATIVSAYVQFAVDENHSGTTDLTVFGQDSGNAPAFTTGTSNISSRTRTVGVPWTNVAPWTQAKPTAGLDQRTPELKTIIQQIVDRGDWQANRPLVLIITGTPGSKRVAVAHDGIAASAPLLVVTYATGGPATTTTTTSTTTTSSTTSTTATTVSTTTSSTTTTTVPPAGTTVSIPVSTNNDDAEERTTNGAVTLGSSDLELVLDSVDQVVGIRFLNVPIPHLATIVSAYVQFAVDENHSGTTNLTVFGQDSGNALAFTTGTSNISSRTRTVGVPWTNVAPWTQAKPTAGMDQRTPELKTIIQQIVDRGDWQANRPLVLIITGTPGSKRVAVAHDGIAGSAPLLVVTYAP